MSLDSTLPAVATSVCDRIQMDNSGLRRRKDPHSDHIRTFSEWTPSLRNVTTLRTTSLNRIISVIFVMLTAASLLHSSGADADLLRVKYSDIFFYNITDNEYSLASAISSLICAVLVGGGRDGNDRGKRLLWVNFC